MPGPLGLSLLALFGPGSFSKGAQLATTADDGVLRALCRTVPFHFNRYRDELMQSRGGNQDGDIHPSICSRSLDGIEWYMPATWQDEYLFDLIGVIGLGHPIQSIYKPPTSFGGRGANNWLSMAMHYANQAWLDIASSNYVESGQYPICIWNIPGLEYSKPRVSTAGVVAVSVLLGLQVLGLLFLLGYIYSTPTWTDTLDSLAIARIAHQLPDEDQDLLKKIGLRRARSSELKTLRGVVEEANTTLLSDTDAVKEPKVSESTV